MAANNSITTDRFVLLNNLIWPAVAGNVAWAFFTVLITEKLQVSLLFGRLAALFLLSVYLIIVYLRSEAGSGHLFDILHSISIIMLAIALQANISSIPAYLITLFVVASFGHWSGRWLPDFVVSKKKLKQTLMGLINFSGAVICFLLPKLVSNIGNYNLSISMTFVLILWLMFRNKLYSKWEKAS